MVLSFVVGSVLEFSSFLLPGPSGSGVAFPFVDAAASYGVWWCGWAHTIGSWGSGFFLTACEAFVVEFAVVSSYAISNDARKSCTLAI